MSSLGSKRHTMYSEKSQNYFDLALSEATKIDTGPLNSATQPLYENSEFVEYVLSLFNNLPAYQKKAVNRNKTIQIHLLGPVKRKYQMCGMGDIQRALIGEWTS